MGFLDFLKLKTNAAANTVAEPAVDLTPVDLGITEHGLEGRLSLIEGRKIYSTDSEDGKHVHWFLSKTKVVLSAYPGVAVHNYHSDSRTIFRDHEYVGSIKLPHGWLYERVNHRIRPPNGKILGFTDLFRGVK